jgi:RHS repeat-associated protein
VTTDGVNSYAYDSEGRLCAVLQPSYMGGVQYRYIYDASGLRVAKASFTGTFPAKNTVCAAAVPGSNVTLTAQYLLNLGGEQVTELTGSGAWVHSNVWAGSHLDATYDTKGLHFQLADPLGTRRVQTNYQGVVEEYIQSLPFGDNLNPVIPTGAPSTADDATEHHFTRKERDTESGNDYFGARYYSSAMGRFMSPDWSAKVEPVPYAKLDDPQSLNLYAYVMNNPLATVDADGHAPLSWGGFEDCSERKDCNNPIQAQENRMQAQANKEAEKAWNVGPADKYLSQAAATRWVLQAFKKGHFHVSLNHIGDDRYDDRTRTVHWDPHSALRTTGGGLQTPALGFYHEMVHATGNPPLVQMLLDIRDPHFTDLEERRVIQDYETPAARDLGEGTRNDHFGQPYNVASPTSTVPVPQQ